MSARLLIMARAPVPGATKRRLIPAIGARRAARLHRWMLERTVATAARSALGTVELWCTPDTTHPAFESLRERYGLLLRTQRGAGLGERMFEAFAGTRSEEAAVMVGTDCPTLAVDDLRAAAGALGAGFDAALGRATDGGYYLIGLRRADPRVFEEMEWGTGHVAGRTVERFEALGWRWRAVATRPDVDRPADLTGIRRLVRSDRRRAQARVA